MNNKDDEGRHHDTAFIDSVVQEKNITYPTDAKLHKKIVKKGSWHREKTGSSSSSKLHLRIEGHLLRPAFPKSSQKQEESP